MRRLLLVAACVLPLALAGCLGANPFSGLKDPMAGTTFRDGGSNATAWTLEVAGSFHTPTGTWFDVTGANGTCSTAPLREVRDGMLPCRQGEDGPHRHDVHIEDRDGDGRLGKGDVLRVERPVDAENRTLVGNHTLVLSLHRELPLFVIQQRLDHGPAGELRVELFA